MKTVLVKESIKFKDGDGEIRELKQYKQVVISERNFADVDKEVREHLKVMRALLREEENPQRDKADIIREIRAERKVLNALYEEKDAIDRRERLEAAELI